MSLRTVKANFPYEDGSFVTPYKLRRKWLEDLAVTIEQKGLKNIQVVPMVYEGTDQSVIPQWLDYAVKHDWEGLMLNTSVPYKRARHTGCLKIKRFYTVDLRVTAIEEGQNRLAGTMGALVVDYKGNELVLVPVLMMLRELPCGRIRVITSDVSSN